MRLAQNTRASGATRVEYTNKFKIKFPSILRIKNKIFVKNFALYRKQLTSAYSLEFFCFIVKGILMVSRKANTKQVAAVDT